MTAFKAGLIQTNVSNEMAENVAFVREQARLAREAGADFIMTPENTGLIGANRADTLEKAQTEETHGMLSAARASARETGAWFLLGSIHVRVPGEEQIRNRSYLIDSAGGIVASYDKIHMFDVELDGVGGQSYRESSTFKPGDRSVLAETPWGVLGMTICYDLRFPYLYRDLAHAGAMMLSIPSSFTVPTGKAHWHAILRSRAIETGCFVFAPAQVGTHKGSNRQTYGHSIAVAPWGEVLVDAGGENAGFVIADIDLAKVAEARKMVPSLQHDRKYAAPALRKAAVAKAAEQQKPAGGDAVNHRHRRLADQPGLVSGHREFSTNQLQQLAVFQEIVRIAGPAEAFVACHERLVEQHTARLDGVQQRIHQRPMQVVGHHDRAEAPAGQWPGATVFQIGL
jgi:predicted amidohydrolase